MKKYDLLVFIGRMQPIHKGHEDVIRRAEELADKVLVLVGSSNAPRTVRNPFTFAERSEMIKNIFPNVITRPLQDHTYNDPAWIVEVQNHVRETLMPSGQFNALGMSDFRIGLIGCNKDSSSYYLKMFPDWASEQVHYVNPLNATAVRERFFDDDLDEPWEMASVISGSTHKWLKAFQKTEDYEHLAKMRKYLVDYRKNYGEGPFLTADALIRVGGKILVIERGKEYGHGQLALPGGFVNPKETFLNAMLRELREETNLRVPLPVLRGSIASRRVYDDPNRSDRARLVTECFLIELNNETKEPEVRGGDDADKAFWMNISDVRREDFFEDHFHIIKDMLKLA